MSKLLVFTDLHVTVPPDGIIGLSPTDRLRRGLAHAARTHPDADHLILTGDLTHHGLPGEYEELARLLDGLPWPVTPMLGNHDRRAPFQAQFPGAPRDAAGFVQSVIDLPGVRLVCLDTLDEGAPDLHSGWLCPDRMAWLSEALEGAQGRDCVVFLHHPPFETGFTGMDRIGLRNRADLLALLRGAGNVRQMISGHVHRTIAASIDGLPVFTLKSPCHQMPMLLGAEGSGHSVDEPGAYGIVLLEPGRVVVHTEDFTLANLTVATHD